MSDESIPAPADREYSVWLDPESVPQTGRTVRLTPDAETRQAIAARLTLLDLPALDGTATAKPSPDGKSICVSGEFTATVVQACTVTLNPVPAEIAEAFAADFGPDEEAVNLDLTLEDADPVEPFEADGIDLGELLVQHLSLALDPYPRLPDAAMEDVLKGLGDKADRISLNAPSGPFAALAKLKAKD